MGRFAIHKGLEGIVTFFAAQHRHTIWLKTAQRFFWISNTLFTKPSTRLPILPRKQVCPGTMTYYLLAAEGNAARGRE